MDNVQEVSNCTIYLKLQTSFYTDKLTKRKNTDYPAPIWLAHASTPCVMAWFVINQNICGPMQQLHQKAGELHYN
jgi:hypothetical protein